MAFHDVMYCDRAGGPPGAMNTARGACKSGQETTANALNTYAVATVCDMIARNLGLSNQSSAA